MYFSNVRFLRELQMETRSRSRLRELLVLTARCLAIIALVLAFARPFMPEEGDTAKHGLARVAIYIDNSFSMENISRQGPLLEIARNEARDLIRAYGPSARFYVVTNEFAGDEQRWRSHDDFLDYLEEIKVWPVPRSLSEVADRQRSFYERTGHKPSMQYVLSDAQASTFDLETVASDTTLPFTILPLRANKVNNVVADSCWFGSPVRQRGFSQHLKMSVANHGDNDINSGAARLFINGGQVALATYSVKAGSTATVDFSYAQATDGFTYGKIELEDYPVSFDDRLYFAYDARLSIAVTVVNGNDGEAGTSFNALFSNDSVFRLRSFPEGAVDYGAFPGSDLIVLNQVSEISSGMLAELQKYASGGGGIVVIPTPSPAASYSAALSAFALPMLGEADTVAVSTASIDPGSRFWSGVFEKFEPRMNLPRVNFHFRLGPGGPATDRLLALENGDPLLIAGRTSKANVFLFSAPLFGNSTNFSRHAIFVPTFYRIAMASISGQQTHYNIHPDVVIITRDRKSGAEQPPHIVGKDLEVDIIPEKRILNNRLMLFPRSQLTMAGYYTLTQAGQDLMPLAFNHSRIESDLSVRSDADLREVINRHGWTHVKIVERTGESAQARLIAGAGDNQLWKLFIFLALVFFVAECLLLRFFR